MSEKIVSRGKSRRVPPGTPTASNDSEPPGTLNEAILGQGGAGGGTQSTGRDTDLSASKLFELHRRCFSCCSLVLQQRASVEDDKNMMLMQQPKFTGHPLMKAIMTRVSNQGYTDIGAFVDHFTRLIEACVRQHDRQALVDTLAKHVERTGQVDPRRPFKATHQGFPHPIVEDMMAQSALTRKKLQPGGLAHVSVDIGHYFAKAYGLGLSKGAGFVGQPSEERMFLEKRNKKEAEAAATAIGVGLKAPAAGSKAQKKSTRRLSGKSGKQGGVSKKKSKVPPTALSQAASKSSRSLRTTRRHSSADDGALRTRPLFDSDVPTANGPNIFAKNARAEEVQRRVKPRSRVLCYHLQGQVVEMDDVEYGGKGLFGRLTGTAVACSCGCEATLSGAHWLMHNGGRTNSRHNGFPFRFLRLMETKENLFAHYETCDCHQYLCDTCNSWEAPGAPMTKCHVCCTSVHATEECAFRSILSGSDAPPSSYGASAVWGPTSVASPTPVAESGIESGVEAIYEGAGSKSTKAANGALSSSVERDESINKSTASLAWRRPAPAPGAPGAIPPTSDGAVVRSRPCRRKTVAGQRSSRDDARAKAFLMEGDIESLCGGGGSNAATKGRGAAVREETLVWKCLVCARPGTAYTPSTYQKS